MHKLYVRIEGIIVELRVEVTKYMYFLREIFSATDEEFTQRWTNEDGYRKRKIHREEIVVPVYTEPAYCTLLVGYSAFKQMIKYVADLGLEIVSVATKKTSNIKIPQNHIENIDQYITPQLRDYQRDAAQALLRSRTGLVKLPTGSGKTEVMLAISEIFAKNGYRVLVVEPTKNAEKTVILRAQKYGVSAEAFRESMKGSTASVIATTPMILHNYLKTHSAKGLPTIIIYDECHHTSAETWHSLLLKIKPIRAYGMSATPIDEEVTSDLRKMKANDALVHSLIGPVIYRENAASVRIRPYLNIPVLVSLIRRESVPIRLMNENNWAYIRKYVHNDDRLQFMAKLIELLESYDLQSVTFISTKKASRKLLESLNHVLTAKKTLCWFGDNETWHPSCGSEQVNFEDLIERIENRDVNHLICTSHMDEVIDIPSLDACILHEGRKARKTLQRAGRSMRKSAKRKTLLINVEFNGQTILHSQSNARIRSLKKEYGIKPYKMGNLIEFENFLKSLERRKDNEQVRRTQSSEESDHRDCGYCSCCYTRIKDLEHDV